MDLKFCDCFCFVVVIVVDYVFLNYPQKMMKFRSFIKIHSGEICQN